MSGLSDLIKKPMQESFRKLAYGGLYLASLGVGFAKGYNSSRGLESSLILNSSIISLPFIGPFAIGYLDSRMNRTDKPKENLGSAVLSLVSFPISTICESTGFLMGYMVGAR